MCQHNSQSTSDFEVTRQLRHAGGRIVHCTCCGSIGIEFGTSYIIFTESSFFTFAKWFETLRWREEHTEQGKIRIQLKTEPSVMLSLARDELRSVAALLREGVRWINTSNAPIERSSAIPTMPLSASVH